MREHLGEGRPAMPHRGEFALRAMFSWARSQDARTMRGPERYSCAVFSCAACSRSQPGVVDFNGEPGS